MIATVPSLVMAAFFRDLIHSTAFPNPPTSNRSRLLTICCLDPVVSLGATLGFLLAFVVPAVLQWRSRSVCLAKFGEEKAAGQTPYSSHFSHSLYVFATLALGVIAFLYCVITAIIQSF